MQANLFLYMRAVLEYLDLRRGAGTSRRASREDVVEARAGEPVRVGRYAPRVVAVVVARPEAEVLLAASAAACTTARASSIDVNALRGCHIGTDGTHARPRQLRDVRG